MLPFWKYSSFMQCSLIYTRHFQNNDSINFFNRWYWRDISPRQVRVLNLFCPRIQNYKQNFKGVLPKMLIFSRTKTNLRFALFHQLLWSILWRCLVRVDNMFGSSLLVPFLHDYKLQLCMKKFSKKRKIFQQSVINMKYLDFISGKGGQQANHVYSRH